MTLLEDMMPDIVRQVISSDEATELLDRLRSWDGKTVSQWKLRANVHQAALESGDPFEYVEVFARLVQLEREGPLRTLDRKHFNQSLYLLTEELACALDTSSTKAGILIDRAIGSE